MNFKQNQLINPATQGAGAWHCWGRKASQAALRQQGKGFNAKGLWNQQETTGSTEEGQRQRTPGLGTGHLGSALSCSLTSVKTLPPPGFNLPAACCVHRHRWYPRSFPTGIVSADCTCPSFTAWDRGSSSGCARDGQGQLARLTDRQGNPCSLWAPLPDYGRLKAWNRATPVSSRHRVEGIYPRRTLQAEQLTQMQRTQAL